MDDLSLAADFPQATREQWLKLVEGVLKGADFSKKLVSRTHDGIEIQPLYPKAEGAGRIAREQAGCWRVSQRVDHPDPAKANELALVDLEGGADALTLVTHRAPAARGFGVKAESVEDLDKALSGVMLDLIHLRLDAGRQGRVMAQLLIALAEKRGHKLSDLSLDLGMDPIGGLAAQGGMSVEWHEMTARMGSMLTSLAEKGFNGRAFIADGRAYHEAGASEAQELAAVLATGVTYLRALEAQGHSLDAARQALSFLLVADADEFLTVAKFRALRRLWAQVEQACGLEPKPIRLHAETAWRMTTKRDPWVNMLRATVATFSAGIGGADAITVLPFTAALGLPDAFARRVARNTQLILLEESNLWRVADPAAGAGGFEALTDALCEKAWILFQELEREGGILESLRAGSLQNRIAATCAQRERTAATRKEPITGTSEFPNIHEADVTVLMPSAPDANENADPSAVTVEPLPSIRTAEAFERLRDLSDAYLARTGARPKVFLANLGPISAFTARATFAKNFFESGGIEAVTNDGFSDNAKLREAFLESKAELTCICSSDEIYATHAEDAAKTLHEAGSPPIYLAGRPGDREEELTRAGITTFIYAGCDTLKVLSEALDKAGA
ncbi:methylmalonyl-CoA mutase family protein [Microvirga guangxiensis]|uniref:Methylmalonyl-CoA mutase n=1 Tax=Microvirga guangxiensis TaxID=549386 RepID=A0A1G5C7U0_9HYPH|nr:methylmalonyl-CoA mutase family protein [Microvirga guangxiensis]SCX98503.1 methylmalonyl-CoA mutase [Microvirga guangxiensis]